MKAHCIAGDIKDRPRYRIWLRSDIKDERHAVG